MLLTRSLPSGGRLGNHDASLGAVGLGLGDADLAAKLDSEFGRKKMLVQTRTRIVQTRTRILIGPTSGHGSYMFTAWDV